MKKYCTNCGKQIPEIALVCPYCGARQQPISHPRFQRSVHATVVNNYQVRRVLPLMWPAFILTILCALLNGFVPIKIDAKDVITAITIIRSYNLITIILALLCIVINLLTIFSAIKWHQTKSAGIVSIIAAIVGLLPLLKAYFIIQLLIPSGVIYMFAVLLFIYPIIRYLVNIVKLSN